MKQHQKNYLNLSTESEALTFGEFTLKSGRVSPYFFNAGKFKTGASLAALGAAYAQAIVDSGIEYDVIFGPAYKGVPLAAATAIALANEHNINIPWAFNRKEAKQHGEGGSIVGADINGQRVLVIDDVITAGTAIRDVHAILTASSAKCAGVVIGLDRKERGSGVRSAVEEVSTDLNAPVISIIDIDIIIQWLQGNDSNSDLVQRMQQYRDTYGI